MRACPDPWIAFDAHPMVSCVVAPTFILHPSSVAFFPLAWAQEIANAIPGAQLTVIESASVAPHGSNAPRVAEALTGFVLGEARVYGRRLPLGVQPWDRASGTPLTPREVGVLCLIAEGLSNPKIAEALSISHGTVARRVSNVLRKISCTNRTEAARWAVERGLTRRSAD